MEKAKEQPEIVELPLADIKPYADNPRFHDDAEVLKRSITKYGYLSPIIVNADNVILAGHGRRLALLDLGYETVRVLRVTNLTPAQECAFRIMDNRSAEISFWDDSVLKNEVDAILADAGADVEGLIDLGFTEDELNNITGGGYGDDEPDIDMVSDFANAPIAYKVSLEFDIADKDVVETYVKKQGKQTICNELLERAKEAAGK